MVADGHHGDDLLGVQEQGQRPLGDHRGFNLHAFLIAAANRDGEPGVVRAWLESEFFQLAWRHAQEFRAFSGQTELIVDYLEYGP